MTPMFSGGRNIAMKVPPHQWETTGAFYRAVLGRAELEPFDGSPPSVGFAFGTSSAPTAPADRTTHPPVPGGRS